MFLSVLAEGFYYEDTAIILFNGKRLDFRSQPVMNEGMLCVPIEEFASLMNFALLKKKGEFLLDDRFKQILFRVNQDQVEVNGRKAYLPMKVFFHKTDWYVPLNYLAWFEGYTLNRKDRFYYISKQIQKAEIESDSLKLVFGCGIEEEAFSLSKEGAVTVLSIPNSVLAFPRVILKSKSLGEIQIGQITAAPDLVKVIFLASENIEVVKQKNMLIVKRVNQTAQIAPEVPSLTPLKTVQKLEKLAAGPRSTEKAVWLPNMTGIHDVTVMIRGKTSLIKGPAKVVDGDYYLPIDDLLIPFGYDYLVDDKGRLQVKYADKQEQILPITPLRVGDRWFVPVQKIATSLGMGLRWDWKTRVLRVNPIIYDVHYQKSPDSEAIQIHSYVEMSPREVFALPNPPRLVLDIPNAVLDTKEKSLAVTGSNFINVRAGQLNEDTVRVVIDLKVERNYALALSDDGTTAYILGAGKIKQILFSEEKGQAKLLIDTAALSSFNVTQQGQELHIDFQNVQYEAKPAYFFTGPYLTKVFGVQQSWSPLQSRMTIMLQKGVQAQVQRTGDDVVVILRKALGVVAPKTMDKSQYSTVPYKKGPLSGKKIVVEAGHGGIDVGSIGFGGLYEKVYNLDISKRVQTKLIAQGATVIMPLQSDQYMSLSERTMFANRNKADFYLSCHLNSLEQQSMNGVESYFFKPEDLAPAKAIQQALLKKLGRPDRGVRKARFFVLFHTDMPAVLIEPAYFSNQEEYNLLLTEPFREKIAEGVVEGILNYYAHR